MNVILLLITASTLVAAVFLAAFIKAVRSGQFDDDRSPAVRMLNDDGPLRTVPTPSALRSGLGADPTSPTSPTEGGSIPRA